MTTEPGSYTSNAGLPEVAERLRRARKAVLLTHSKPDGDAVGSTLALARTLHRLSIGAVPLYLPPWQERMEAVIGATPVLHESAGCYERPPLSEADTVAVLDTGSWSQLAGARGWLEPRADAAVIIDHHSHGNNEVAALRHIDPRAASACDLVAEVCRLLLGVDSFSRLPVEVAEPLYLGVATDTGWFRYSNMKSATLRLAADLIDAGVDHNRLYRRIEQADSPSRLRIIERALASLELLDAGRAAMMCITREDIRATGASQDEIGGLTDLPQTIGAVRVIAVLTEVQDAITKVSFRSKASDPGQAEIDVNALAQTFGGGGHVHAAGAKIRLPLAQAKREVAAALEGVPK